MTVHDALFERVRRADPAPPDRHVEVQALRRLVDDRIQFPPPRRRGPAIAIAAALAAAAIVIPIVVLRDADPAPGPVATTAPAPDTTVPETTTAPPTTEAPTTTAAAAPAISITWTLVESPAVQQPDLDITGITVTPSGLIATGAIWAATGEVETLPIVGPNPIFAPTATILWSADGLDWTPVELDSFEGANPMSVASRGDLVVVSGLAGPDDANLEPRVWTSLDAGLTWQTIRPEGDGLLYTVLATDDLLVAAGYGIWVSTDGLEWRKVSDEEIIWALAETPDGFVATGNRFTPPPSATTIWESPDGETWVRARGRDGALEHDGWQASLAVAAGSAGGTTLAVGGARLTSPDGGFHAAVWRLEEDGTWARLPRDSETFGGAQAVQMRALVDADGMWIAVGDMSDERMSTSKGRVWASGDGATWFRLDPEGDVFGTYGDGSVTITNLTFDGERLIAVGRRNGVGAIWIGTIER